VTLTVGSLFSGIGGLDLGLERAGMTVRWQAESDPYARQVLAKHWPDIPCYPDVRSLPDDIEPVDLVAGGYPCQPFSLAGGRSGTDDPRHLWPHFARTLRVLRPRWALLENVPGHLSLGFDDVISDLAALGYDTEWTCIPAAAVGAPHLRWRLFVVAHANGQGEPVEPVDGDAGQGVMVPGPMAHADSQAWRPTRTPGETVFGPEAVERLGRRGGGLGDSWLVEPDVGRVAHGVPHRVDRLRTLGNAVVPQVAELVGRMIVAAE
jgi:DNA (cytosine-5)-methyltransferase 1